MEDLPPAYRHVRKTFCHAPERFFKSWNSLQNDGEHYLFNFNASPLYVTLLSASSTFACTSGASGA